jgi:hypothetical protein
LESFVFNYKSCSAWGCDGLKELAESSMLLAGRSALVDGGKVFLRDDEVAWS